MGRSGARVLIKLYLHNRLGGIWPMGYSSRVSHNDKAQRGPSPASVLGV